MNPPNRFPGTTRAATLESSIDSTLEAMVTAHKSGRPLGQTAEHRMTPCPPRSYPKLTPVNVSDNAHKRELMGRSRARG